MYAIIAALLTVTALAVLFNVTFLRGKRRPFHKDISAWVEDQ